MFLVRDVLDNRLLDRRKRKMGRVDGVVLSVAPGEQPRVTHLEIGGVTLARRVHPRLARWLARRGRPPYRIPWARVRDVGIDVTVDVDAEKTPALAWERWIREKVIGRIPGA
jgi:hypothetical protein